MKEWLTKVFPCYSSETTSMRDVLVDQIHAISLVSFLLIVFFDWPYWKTAPFPLHTMIVYGIIFTFMFIRFSTSQIDHRDVQSLVFKQINHLPKALAALLSGLNSIILTIFLSLCRSTFPDFLKTPYCVLTLIIIVSGYLQLCYAIYSTYILVK